MLLEVRGDDMGRLCKQSNDMSLFCECEEPERSHLKGCSILPLVSTSP